MTTWTFRLASFGVIWTAFAISANAATIEVDDLEGSKLIYLSGKIEAGDERKFNNVAATIENAVVALSSDGGSTVTAIEIGKSIRLKGFSTLVFNGSPCNSACALIWLGGSARALSKSARIGFHATYIDVSGRKLESGAGNAIVGRYLTLLNLSERAVIFATESPPDSLNWLTSANLASLGIEAQTVDDLEDEQTSQASQPSPDTAEQSSSSDTQPWGNAGGWQINVDSSLNNSCYMIASWTEGVVLRIGFDVRDRLLSYLMIGHPNWKSLSPGKKYKMNVQFGEETPWTVEMTGRLIGKQPMLFMTFSNANFWTEFRRSKTVKLEYVNRTVGYLKLEGSNLGFEKLVECQKYHISKSSDPFAR